MENVIAGTPKLNTPLRAEPMKIDLKAIRARLVEVAITKSDELTLNKLVELLPAVPCVVHDWVMNGKGGAVCRRCGQNKAALAAGGPGHE